MIMPRLQFWHRDEEVCASVFVRGHDDCYDAMQCLCWQGAITETVAGRRAPHSLFTTSRGGVTQASVASSQHRPYP